MLKRVLMMMVGMAWSVGALATAQCPDEARCAPLPDDFAVAMRAEIDALPRLCARRDPAHALDYDRLLAQALAGMPEQDRKALAAALVHPAYPALLEHAIEDVQQQRDADALDRRCARLIAPADASR